MLGSISGAHVNPGITLGALSVGRIGKRDALFYIIAQLLGGLAAYGISLAFGHVMPEFVTDFSVVTLVAEIIGMTVFAFGVASAMSGSRGQGMTAVLVGGSLMVGSYISGGLGSYGLLNPAIALGVSVWGISYLVGPLVGGVLGMWLYKLLNSAK
jgi:aquaporin Z